MDEDIKLIIRLLPILKFLKARNKGNIHINVSTLFYVTKNKGLYSVNSCPLFISTMKVENTAITATIDTLLHW